MATHDTTSTIPHKVLQRYLLLRRDASCNVTGMTKATRLASRRDAADYAGVSVMTIARWIKAGRLREYRTAAPAGPGRPAIRVDLDEIDQLQRPVAS